jgi:hypothetical protein
MVIKKAGIIKWGDIMICLEVEVGEQNEWWRVIID